MRQSPPFLLMNLYFHVRISSEHGRESFTGREATPSGAPGAGAGLTFLLSSQNLGSWSAVGYLQQDISMVMSIHPCHT